MEQLDLPQLWQLFFQQQWVWLQGNNFTRYVIKSKTKITDVSDTVWRRVRKMNSLKKTAALTLLLPTMFDWIDKTMNERYEVWRQAHQKYRMSIIIQKLYSNKKTALTLMLPMMSDLIDELMD